MYQIILDPGHGIDTAGKCSPDKKLYEWSNNRELAALVKTYAEFHGFKVVMTVTDSSDPSLTERAEIANKAARDFAAEDKNNKSVFISLHSDASKDTGWGKARGFSIWTTPGRNKSDVLADSIWVEVVGISLLHGFPLRTFTTTEHDFEANFTVLQKAKMPAVLIENLFHDNREDLKLLLNKSYLDDIARAIINGVQQYVEKMNQ